MNREIKIKDRATINYESFGSESGKMEMTFKEFKAEFLRDKSNISKIEIVSYQKFDKELLSIASLIEDFKFISRIENDLTKGGKKSPSSISGRWIAFLLDKHDKTWYTKRIRAGTARRAW